MASKTIHTLAYKLLVDSADFEKGMVASRRELSTARREMGKMLTPTEKMQVSLDKLGNIAKKDAKFQELYNRKLADYQKHLVKIAREESRITKIRGSLNSVAGGIVGVLGVGAIAANIRRQIENVDQLSKVADNLGISLEQLTRIQFAASKISGLSADQTSKALEKMVRRTAEAAAGTGEAKGVIEELGLSAQTLADSKPDEAFMMIARAMQQITEQGDRVRIATKLFDDEQARIHTTLGQVNGELERQFDLADKLGATVNSIDAAKMVEAKDAMTEFQASFDAFSRQFSELFMPAITTVLRDVSEWVERNYGDGKAAGTASALWEAADFGGGNFKDRVLAVPRAAFGVGMELATGDIQRRNERDANDAAIRKLQQDQLKALEGIERSLSHPERMEQPAI